MKTAYLLMFGISLLASVFSYELDGSASNRYSANGHFLPAGPVDDDFRPDGLHTQWDALLKEHVTDQGKVDYKGLKTRAGELNEYIVSLSDKFPDNSWSRNEAMAFWINLYNAATVKLIVDNYPLKSIMGLENGKVWDRAWIAVGQKKYSLNQIEHEVLRAKYKDPRIHFAVNCAATSCPKLLNRAWTAENLESMLEKQTREFVNHDDFNKLNGKNLKVSRIFEWYAEDFGDLHQFLDRYTATSIPQSARISYLDYDWSLNEKK